MNGIAVVTDWVNITLALGVAGVALSIGGHITRETRCALRLGIFAIFAGALASAAGGAMAFGAWVQSIFSGGVLVYMLANTRQPVALPSEAWANRVAWAVAGVVLTVLAFSLSAAT